MFSVGTMPPTTLLLMPSDNPEISSDMARARPTLLSRMAQERSTFCFLLALLCAIDAACGQNSVFRVLSADELRNTSLRQNPELLKFAARTGETVRIEIRAVEQGAVIQEGVTATLDCGPWLTEFPRGTIRWYKYYYIDLDHTELGPRVLQNPEIVNRVRATITGASNETYTIWGMRDLILDDEEGIRGIYECEVCDGIPGSEDCHSANTTVATVGRPPIIDAGGPGEVRCVIVYINIGMARSMKIFY